MSIHIPLGIVGISHKTASVEVRDSVALASDEQDVLLSTIRSQLRVEGCMILSTCNRTEVYFSAEATAKVADGIRTILDASRKCAYFSDPATAYEKHGVEAVRHFFRVISGIDSQIVGEMQITGQVKDSYNHAHDAGATDAVINKIFNYGMQARKAVYSDTYLYDGTVSVSFAGVELARKIFSKLDAREVALIGAGKTAELAAYHFMEDGVKSFHVVNRTKSKAIELADKLNGKAYDLDALEEALQNADIVISATSSTTPVLTRDILLPVCKSRQSKPIFLIDLAVPRDIEPSVENIDNVYLYNLDDLQEIVTMNLEKRKKEIPKAEKILDEYVEDFEKWVSTNSMTWVIGRLKQRLETLRLNEIERLKSKLPSNGYKKEIDHLTESIVNKVIRHHVKFLKKNASDPEVYQKQIEMIRSMFELDED